MSQITNAQQNPTNWRTDGARLKDAVSDAIKRCAMAIGVGLHLWSQFEGKSEYFLDKQLEKTVPVTASEDE